MRPSAFGWQIWLGIGLAAAADIIAGIWLNGNAATETWMYRIGLTALTAAPVLFIAIYSALAPWWKDKLGSSLVLAAASVIPVAMPLAWVFWFDHGLLTSSWLAWFEVSGPCVSAVAWLNLCLVWISERYRRGR